MTTKQNSNIPCSYFDVCGDFEEGVATIVQEVAEVYLADDIPWTNWIQRRQGLDRDPTTGLVCIATHWRSTGTQTCSRYQHGHAC